MVVFSALTSTESYKCIQINSNNVELSLLWGCFAICIVSVVIFECSIPRDITKPSFMWKYFPGNLPPLNNFQLLKKIDYEWPRDIVRWCASPYRVHSQLTATDVHAIRFDRIYIYISSIICMPRLPVTAATKTWESKLIWAIGTSLKWTEFQWKEFA